MTKDINDLASVHLGRTSDGKTMTRYETPNEIDASLLVAIPRHLNRTAYSINDSTFMGNDRWNCYEFSTLMENGFPLSGRLIIVFNWNTFNIVESKSLKLYLNSFNMHRFLSLCPTEMINAIENRVYNDLTAANIPPRYIEFIPDAYSPRAKDRQDYLVKNREEYENLEALILIDPLWRQKDFAFEGQNPDLLKVVRSNELYGSRPYESAEYKYWSSSLRSNCRVTNQPDWGDIYIAYKTNKLVVTPESLYRYIISLRTENHFHEEICEAVYKALMDKLNPLELMVACLYTRRGGIDINPMRVSSANYANELLNSPMHVDIMKESRQ